MPTDLPTPLPLLQLDSPVIVIDVESTGLDIHTDIPVEVAWYNLATGDRGEFVPHHDPDRVLALAHPGALAVNGYRERIYPYVHAQMDHDRSEAAKLWAQLTDGRHPPYLAGAQVAGFDQFMIAKLWPVLRPGDFPWRHRIFDVANMGRQELGLGYLPSLTALVELLGLDIPRPDHTAMGDVYTTTLVLVELLRRADVRLGIIPDETGARVVAERNELGDLHPDPAAVVRTTPKRATLQA